MIKIQAFGESALLIEFEQKISKEIHQQVMTCKEWIQKNIQSGITFLTPAYCSLCVGFDRQLWQTYELKEQIQKGFDKESITVKQTGRALKIPVCYELASDREELEDQLGLDWTTFVEKHTASTYQVYMLGFLPGFPYMGTLDAALQCKRKRNPRKQVPAQSVAIAGLQTGIYPIDAPGGWQLIGQTPMPIVDIYTEQQFLFQAGDQVRFYPIEKKEFYLLEDAFREGHWNWEECYE
jgi:inhibitor of KinA